MATTFKTLGTNDIVTTKTLLHEAIPITGSIVSGTYGASEENIKNYTHGMFQSVYDYPYLSSSANHIFDITLGYSVDSANSASSNRQNSKKINIYTQMAQVLMGYDTASTIFSFTSHGVNTGSFMDTCYFLCFSRLLNKDEIKKGSFTLELGVSASYAASSSTDRGYGSPAFGTGSMQQRIQLLDHNAQNDYRVDSPAGEYGILRVTGSYLNNKTAQPLSKYKTLGDRSVGLLFYQAGIAVITASVFVGATSPSVGVLSVGKSCEMTAGPVRLMNQMLSGSEISASADAFRHRIWNLSFNNTTELNSTIYFCRAGHSDFNYSANPTYLSSSKLVVKNESTDEPVSYITTVGLYSADNEMLAIAKLSEPLKKTPSTEFTIRTRLDY